MLFLGIDQHARQLTVSLRDRNGDVLLARQVSTQPDKILDAARQDPRRRRLLQLGKALGYLRKAQFCGKAS
jgi:hypothetical protein